MNIDVSLLPYTYQPTVWHLFPFITILRSCSHCYSPFPIDDQAAFNATITCACSGLCCCRCCLSLSLSLTHTHTPFSRSFNSYFHQQTILHYQPIVVFAVAAMFSGTMHNILHSIHLKYLVGLIMHVKDGSSCDSSAVLRPAYESIEDCNRGDAAERASQTAVAELDGTLTRSQCAFPYFMLVAFEAGSPLRGLILLLLWPLIWAMRILVSEAASVHMLIFISMVGIKEAEIDGVGRAVLCKFYLEDMHPHAYKVFIACGRRCVVTSNPRVMVEPFLKEYLGVELVLGTELHTWKGFCTGLLRGPGVLVGEKKRDAVQGAFKMQPPPDLGLMGASATTGSFLSLCKQGYVVATKQVEAVAKEDYLKPLIFHDGRLAIRPTPVVALFIYLWFPMGLVLSVLRLASWLLLPAEIATPIGAFLGVRVKTEGAPPLIAGNQSDSGVQRGHLYVCTHRTLMDPVFVSLTLRRKVAAVTYSISRVSEFISPIKVVKLTRDREEDARTIDSVLQQGDLVICPEGTTCREQYLLRFSPLFAEMTNNIVPVCIQVGMSLFHGTTARGYKGMDPFFFLMNPCPSYHITILDPLPKEDTCASGKTSFQVANQLQKHMASYLGYQCTTLTRRDKYHVLARNDGLVVPARISRSVHNSVNNHNLVTKSCSNMSRGLHNPDESLSMVASIWVSLWRCFINTKQGH